MKHIILALSLAAAGCGSTLPADTMTKFAHVLEATKSAYVLVCAPPPDQQLQCRSPDIDAICATGGAYVNSAIGLYTQLNDSLKE